MHALHSSLLISDMLLAILDNEGFNYILSHFLHLKHILSFLFPIKSHYDLIFFPFMHTLHSSLLISDKLSTRFDNQVGKNLKLSINFSLYVIVLIASLLSYFFNYIFNWYRKSNILFHIFSYAIKFAIKFFC